MLDLRRNVSELMKVCMNFTQLMKGLCISEEFRHIFLAPHLFIKMFNEYKEMMQYDSININRFLSSINWSSGKATNTFHLFQNLLWQYMHNKFNNPFAQHRIK